MQDLINNFFNDSNIEIINLNYQWNFEIFRENIIFPKEIISFLNDKQNNSVRKYVFQNEQKYKLFLSFNHNLNVVFDSNYIYFFDTEFNLISRFQNFTNIDNKKTPTRLYINFENHNFDYPKTLLHTIKKSESNNIFLDFSKEIISVYDHDNYIDSIKITSIQFKDDLIYVNLHMEHIECFIFNLAGVLKEVVFYDNTCSLLNLDKKSISIKNYNSIVKYTSKMVDDYYLLTDIKIEIINKDSFDITIDFIKKVISIKTHLNYNKILNTYNSLANTFYNKNLPKLKNYDSFLKHLDNLPKVELNEKNLNHAIMRNYEFKLIYGIHILQSFEKFIFEDKFLKNLLYLKNN